KGAMMRQGMASLFGIGNKGMTPPAGMQGGQGLGMGGMPNIPSDMKLPSNLGNLSGLGKKK
ncbi:hypothetical protein, partial [Acinetobacter baumannii]|uniref:hypothetical protein n=1 Tax=Acinetobacter baumannii TaxID=470 RepID=UPI0031F3E7BB